MSNALKRGTINLCMILVSIMFCDIALAGVYRKNLDENWVFKQARLNNWYKATVPGVVHTDLMANGIIDDPFYRLNERAVQWIDKEDWIYETTIIGEDEVIDKDMQRLVFKGLDTYADVFLNDSLILSADNMFREWTADVKGLLKNGENKLRVYFHSPIKVDMPKWESLPYQLRSDNDQSDNGGLLNRKIGIFARKAGYHYGWDWGPRLVTSGIWRPIYLEAWNDIKVEDVHIIQKKVTSECADISTTVEILSTKDFYGANISVKADGIVMSKKIVDLKKGLNRFSLDYKIENPKLWWTNGLGEAYLYKFSTSVTLENNVSDSVNHNIGIRSLNMIAQKDKFGTSLYFELNGVPVFMKGANYIPGDSFLPRITKEKYEKEILDAKNANMNMLRIWGGGIYEDDSFYDFCDKHGILVWQDFMFACALYPSDEAFIENVRQEAIYNVKRLRNHSSIALWCGNNEIIDAWYGWGWKKEYESMGNDYSRKLWNDLYNLYFNVLPKVVEEYGGGIGYRGSSPLAYPDKRSDGINGDSHYWGVWHGNHPISQYNTERSRFFSEYGFQSFPEFESVMKYAPLKEDHSIESEVMMSHQRGGTNANNKIKEYMLKSYNAPKDFESFLYVGSILQGDAIKTAMEAHRRDMPYCMGSLFWQHNDCWPVASWSGRDYYGRWKAQHYFARKAYDMILVSPIISEDNLTVHIVSDLLESVKGRFSLKVMDMDGNIIRNSSKYISTPKNGSKLILKKNINDLLDKNSKQDVIILAEFSTPEKTYSNIVYAVEQKDLNLKKVDIDWTAKRTKDGYIISIKSNKFARGVFLSIPGKEHFFEDNYFDLLPNRITEIIVKTSISLDELNKLLEIRSLIDSYNH